MPLLVAALAVFLKVVARPAGKRKLQPDDFLIGFELGVTAVVTMLTVAAKAAREVQELNEKLLAVPSTAAADVISALAVKIQHSVTLAVAAPLLVIVFSVALLVLSWLAARRAWDSNGTLRKGWILGVDGFGLFLLAATLLMTGEVK